MTIYYGEDAIEQVEKREGPLTEAQKRLVVLEGFSDATYLDDKLIRTTGVGQTQGASDLSFKEVWARFEGQLENEVPGYRALPPVLQSSLMNLHYRGDLLDTNWLNLFNAGKYDEAARELLNHEEFTDLIAAGATSDSNSIVRRISAAANNIKGFGTNSITPATGRAGGVAAMSPPQTRNSILAKLEQALINADRAGRTEDAPIFLLCGRKYKLSYGVLVLKNQGLLETSSQALALVLLTPERWRRLVVLHYSKKRVNLPLVIKYNLLLTTYAPKVGTKTR